MRVLVAAVAVWLLVGCDAGRGCTDVGGFDGVGVQIPRSLFMRSGEVSFEVCDVNGCGIATQGLRRVPGEPVGRGASVTFDDLGREYEPGPVTVTVELSRPDGGAVARTTRQVVLVRSYPNGKACDGDGYVGGAFKMRPADRV